MKYIYKINDKNKIIKGNIEAENEAKVVEYLKSKDLLIIEIKKQESTFLQLFRPYFVNVSFTDIVNLTRQLAIMLNAGLTIVDSFDILKKQSTKPGLLKLIYQIDEDIKAGNSLSTAFKKNKQLFSNLYISLIKAGEASGKLDQILLKLAENLEKQREFQGKIKGALIYPAIVIISMFAVMFIMITFVIPQLLNLYKDFNIALPFTTQILILISSFFQKFWPIILAAFFCLSILFRKYITTKHGKRLFDSWLLNLPVIKNVIKMSALVDTTRTFAILISAGVSILDSLDIVIETSSNIIYQEAFQRIYRKIEKGESLGRSLEEEEIFPPILVQMTAVGEQTGHLDETLMRISKYFEMESELAVKAMTTLIEPAILLFLGVGVGFLVISVITPIYNLTSSFK
jgi:type IV pilus assembly protein PilC